MMSLSNVKIRTKLLLMLVFPVAGLLYFSLYGIAGRLDAAREMGTVEGLAELSVRISALVHETQRERGMTAGFLGSKGAQFATELPQQRQATDSRRKALREFITDDGQLALTETVRRRLDGSIQELERIDAIRSSVTGLNIPAGEAIGYYTALNASLLGVISELPKLTDDGMMVRAITAYVNFLLGKERAGIERAVLANTFAADRFGTGMFNRFAELVAAQNTYADVFRRIAAQEDIEFFEQTMRSPFVDEVERMRKIAFEQAVEGGFGVDATHWFRQQTGRIDLLKEVEDRLSSGLIADAGELRGEAERELLFFTALTVVSVGAAFILAVLMIRSIASPLRSALAAMLDIAEGEGDLTRRLDDSGRDEIGQLAGAFNAFVEKLQGMLISIKDGARSIDVSTGEIAQGNLNLSQRTEEQAASLEETASSMEQMTSTVRQNADNARQANILAGGARESAEQGGAVVKKAVHAMDEMTESSKKIAEIISVIDSIAFQTNLLALNAAVEAARAGEQGRGFAVVAGEVRSLAQRSAEAAREIKELIEESVERVHNGASLVKRSGETLDEIMAGVKRVTDIVSEIAGASQEQASGIEQVNKAIMQMDEATQQNAALVEEAAAASKSMEEQTRGLLRQIGFFKLGD